MYPITLNIAGKRCVVAGGGSVAYSKIGSLLQANANVTVVSPEFIPEIEQLYEEGEIFIRRKTVEYDDYKEAFLIIAATDVPELNREIYERVKDTKLVNVVSDSRLGNFQVPATLSRGKLQISVATSGASPLLAKQIRDELLEKYDESYEDYLEFLYELRMKIKQSKLSKEAKRSYLREALDEKYKDSIPERTRLLRIFYLCQRPYCDGNRNADVRKR